MLKYIICKNCDTKQTKRIKAFKDSGFSLKHINCEECGQQRLIEISLNKITFDVLKIWLFGGQIDFNGNVDDGFNTFNEFLDDLKTNQQFENAIFNVITDCGGVEFSYFDEKYFIPTEINLTTDQLKELISIAKEKQKNKA